jgi:hypothetical protein
MNSDKLLCLVQSQLGFPWYWGHLVAILCGLGSLFAAFSRQPIHGRNGDPYPNQSFFKACYAILGIAMIGLSVWGLWLRTP